jgi:AraC family transcriptional regulator
VSPATHDPHGGATETIPPVPMFSAPGHQDTFWSDVKGKVARSRQIAWEGGTAATHAIERVSGAAEVRTRSLDLHFSWNFGRAEADAQSGKQLRSYRNRPRYGLILPPGTAVEFRIEEKSAYKFLAMEFEPHYVLRVAELQHLCNVEIIEAWDYNHPLTWRLAQAIYEECENDARQGLLYAETAIAFLALHVAKSLSNAAPPVRILCRGGLAPAVLNRSLATIWSADWPRTYRFPRSRGSLTSRLRISLSRSRPRRGLLPTHGFGANASIGRKRCFWIPA